MICSATANTSVTLPFTVGAISPLPGIALAPTILPEAARIEHLFEQVSNALGFALNRTHSYKEIEDRLLTNLLACDANPKYQSASHLLGLSSTGGCYSKEESDKTIEQFRKLLSHSCQSRPTAGCEEKKWSSKDTFAKSVTLGMEDLARIAESLQYNWELSRPDGPEKKKEIIAIGRELLDLQRKIADTHYLFTHGTSRVHAFLPKLITELDRRLWPKRDSKDFIFARVVPPTQPMTQIREIFQRIGARIGRSERRVSDHDLRKELLSVDADLLNRQAGESALDFYLSNRNIFHKIDSIVCDILVRFAEQFGFDYSAKKCEGDLGSGITKALGSGDLGTALRELRYDVGRGAILAYAIPKTLISNPKTNFIYTSSPGGGHLDRDNPLAFLEGMISGQGRNHGFSVRLLTSHLRPENGIKAFWVGEKKDQDPHYLKWRDRFTDIADSFFNKIFQHCQEQSAWFFGWPKLGSKNRECERLLRETSTGTKRRAHYDL